MNHVDVLRLLGLTACLALAASCGPGPVTLAPDFGQSVKAAVERQRLNPESPGDVTPVEGMDGTTATVVLKGYRETFEKQEDIGTKGVLTLIGQ